MSSNRCRVFVARIDLAKIMKLMLRVSSESKYSFFKQMVIQHIVEKMDVVVINGSLTSFVRESWRASLIFKTWDASRVFAASLLLKLALKFSVKNRLLGGRLYKQGNFFLRSLLKVDERESGELFEELFWNDVAYFFPMINFCNLIVERRRNGNDIFCLRKLLPESNFPSFSTLLFRDGGNIVGVFRNFLLFEADACVNWTDRSLSSFSERKKM